MKQTAEQLQQHFLGKMCATGKLFRVNVGGRIVWKEYLANFNDNDDPVFRDPESSAHNCNNCNNFIRRYGNVVAIGEHNEIITLFDIDPIEEEYKESFKVLSELLSTAKIEDVFVETYSELNSLPYESCNKTQELYQLGMTHNTKRYTKEEAVQYGVVRPNELRTFNHINVKLPKKFVDFSGQSEASIISVYRDKKEVFKRGMDEISLDTMKLVKDLIVQGSLLDGEAHLPAMQEIIKIKESMPLNAQDEWFWLVTYDMHERIAKFRNTLLGTLCVELTQGEDLNEACRTWNKRVDPANYMKATAPITQSQIKDAEKFVEAQGYSASFSRRLATLDDIKASEIKFMDEGEGGIKKASIFDSVKSSKPTQHKKSKFDGLEEVTINKFMKDVLPECTSVEVLLENKHENNLTVLTTSDITGKNIFKWDNNYSWTTKANLAGVSQIKQAVKTAGGAVDGVLRFSIMWSEGDGDNSDLDAHARCKGEHISYSSKRGGLTKGSLDIDIQNPLSQMPNGAVENITYPDLATLQDREIDFFVHQYSEDNSQGFRAEVEFGGETYQYEYPRRVSGNIKVATVTIDAAGNFGIKHHIQPTNGEKEVWGVKTQNFHKVNLLCLSPNHWGANKVGNKYYMFMLEGCQAEHSLRTFHNENLNADLLKHRKVMEVLGATTTVEPTENHLAGLAFNATVRNELIVKCKGSFERMLKIKF